MNKVEFYPQRLVVYQQAYCFTKLLYEWLGDFALKDYNRLYFRSAQRRWAKKIDPPSIALIWDEAPRDQEDVSLWDYFPIGAFVSRGSIPASEASDLFDIKVTVSVGEVEVLPPFKGATVGMSPGIDGMPPPEIAEETPLPGIYRMATLNQRIKNIWRVDFEAKVLDPFGEGYSATGFLAEAKRYFPLHVFRKVEIKEVPMRDGKTIISFDPACYFIIRMIDHSIEQSMFETTEPEERKIVVSLTFESQQFMLAALPLGQRIVFPSLRNPITSGDNELMIGIPTLPDC